MIFVITGTEAYSFDRFIKEIDRLKKSKVIKDDVFIQLGSCKYEPENCKFERYLSFGQMRENIEKAKIVIAHAGAGTTLLCLQMGKIPILVTRHKKYGEHLDDHQVPFAKNMEKLDYAVVAYEVEDLEKCLSEYKTMPGKKLTTKDNNRDIIKYLDDHVKNQLNK